MLCTCTANLQSHTNNIHVHAGQDTDLALEAASNKNTVPLILGVVGLTSDSTQWCQRRPTSRHSCGLSLLTHGCCCELSIPGIPLDRRPLPTAEPRGQYLHQIHELPTAAGDTLRPSGCEIGSIGWHPHTTCHLFRETDWAWHCRICLRPRKS